nr:hypothetical protein [Phenylobacterium sp.]
MAKLFEIAVENAAQTSNCGADFDREHLDPPVHVPLGRLRMLRYVCECDGDATQFGQSIGKNDVVWGAKSWPSPYFSSHNSPDPHADRKARPTGHGLYLLVFTPRERHRDFCAGL